MTQYLYDLMNPYDGIDEFAQEKFEAKIREMLSDLGYPEFIVEEVIERDTYDMRIAEDLAEEIAYDLYLDGEGDVMLIRDSAYKHLKDEALSGLVKFCKKYNNL